MRNEWRKEALPAEGGARMVLQQQQNRKHYRHHGYDICFASWSIPLNHNSKCTTRYFLLLGPEGSNRGKHYHQNVRIVTFTHRCMKFFCKTLTWLVTWSAKKKSASLTCKRFSVKKLFHLTLVISSIY